MVPFALVLAMVSQVAASEPQNQRMAPRSVALEISRVAETELEAAVMTVQAWREGRNVPNAIGDHGKAFCVYQLQYAPLSVLRDLRQCTELAYARMLASFAACPDWPLALYASGTCSRAHEISDERMAAARALVERFGGELAWAGERGPDSSLGLGEGWTVAAAGVE